MMFIKRGTPIDGSNENQTKMEHIATLVRWTQQQPFALRLTLQEREAVQNPVLLTQPNFLEFFGHFSPRNLRRHWRLNLFFTIFRVPHTAETLIFEVRIRQPALWFHVTGSDGLVLGYHSILQLLTPYQQICRVIPPRLKLSGHLFFPTFERPPWLLIENYRMISIPFLFSTKAILGQFLFHL